jgi:hypothetical protein
LAVELADRAERFGTVHDRLLAARLGLASSEHPASPVLVDRLLSEVEAEIAGQPDSLAALDLVLTGATRHLIEGRLAEVASTIEAATEWCTGADIDSTGSVDRLRLALLWEQGRFAQLDRAAADAPNGLVWQAVAAGETADVERARRLLNAVPDMECRPTADKALAALAAYRAGHEDTATATLRSLIGLRGSLAASASGLVVLGPVAYFAALAALTLHRHDLARSLLSEAEGLARLVNAPAWLIRVLVGQAEVAAVEHDWAQMEHTLGLAKSIAAETESGWLDACLSRPGFQSSSNPFATR